MRIAVAADGPGMENHTEPVLARADWFVVVDDAGVFCESIQNPYRDDREKCGEKVARLLHSHGVAVILAGNRGSKATLACRNLGMRAAFAKAGTVKDAARNHVELENTLGSL